ncbi:hypothetical protein CBL_04616 [Carabus blaptoides fortunei]
MAARARVQNTKRAARPHHAGPSTVAVLYRDAHHHFTRDSFQTLNAMLLLALIQGYAGWRERSAGYTERLLERYGRKSRPDTSVASYRLTLESSRPFGKGSNGRRRERRNLELQAKVMNDYDDIRSLRQMFVLSGACCDATQCFGYATRHI